MKKECTCSEKINPNDCIEIFTPDLAKPGLFFLRDRYEKDCPLHGYKVISDEDVVSKVRDVIKL